MPKEKLVLAIDLGTSGPKVAVASLTGHIHAVAFAPTSLHLGDDGAAEQDPEDWWTAICTASQHVIAEVGELARDIVAVSCTTQWSGTVAVDDKGKALSRAIIWMDTRGAVDIRKLVGGGISIDGYNIGKAQRWLRLTGGAPGKAGKDSIAHILYLQRQQPDLYARAHMFLEPKDYLNRRLTGRTTACFASITLHWLTDNRRLDRVCYDTNLLRRCGIDAKKLPPLIPTASVVGPILASVAEELGVPHSAVVVSGAPDMHSAAIGSGGVEDFQAHLYIGTSSWISCHVPFKKTDLVHSIASLPSALPGKYFLANEQETAGACLTFLRDQLFYREDQLSPVVDAENALQHFNSLAAAVAPGSDGVLFAPWLVGERTPIEDAHLRGMFFNLSLRHNRAHMVRSVFEGVALNSRWLLHYVEKFCRRRFSEIRIIGGGAQSELWCQIFADVLQRPILQVADPIYANVRGAALLAGLTLGALTIEQIPGAVSIARRYQPEAKACQIYDRHYAALRQLHRHNRKLFTTMNRDASHAHA